ncbi:type II toxin-antitoxin system HicA family toxin [Endothiovibrio diazotrophicus]
MSRETARPDRHAGDDGCIFIRHGGRHDGYQNPSTKISQPVPRHREINDLLAKHIIKSLS